MSKLKKIAAIVLCLCVLEVSNLYVWAENTVSKITDICVLKGNFYYCDHNAGKVVMKNVSPVADTEVGREIAEAMEYTEINTSRDALYMKDGTKAEYDWLNNNADDVAYVIAARLDDGSIRIMYFQFK